MLGSKAAEWYKNMTTLWAEPGKLFTKVADSPSNEVGGLHEPEGEDDVEEEVPCVISKGNVEGTRTFPDGSTEGCCNESMGSPRPCTWNDACSMTSVHTDPTKDSVAGADYRGCQNKTITGRTCLKWPATWKLGDHNYCRNPDGELTIWCNVKSG